MGKPIAGRDKSPFGVDGIVVNAAVLADGTKLTNVRISKQRSINVFDLLSADGKTVYEFVSITGLDSSDKLLDVSLSNSQLSDKLAKGTFCISVVDDNGEKTGFAIRFLLNKVSLQDGRTLFLSNYSSQSVVVVLSVSVNPATLGINVGDTATITATVLPANATDKSIVWTSSNTAIATVSSTGVVSAKSAGTANITATTNDGSHTAVTAVTVSAVQPAQQ